MSRDTNGEDVVYSLPASTRALLELMIETASTHELMAIHAMATAELTARRVRFEIRIEDGPSEVLRVIRSEGNGE
jgi:hypothetical protein